MSSDSISGRIRAMLSDHGEQEPQTKTPPKARGVAMSANIERDEPPKDDYRRYRTLYRTFPLTKAGVDTLTAEVAEPGYRIDADEDKTQEKLMEWSEEMAVYAGELNQPLLPLLWQIIAHSFIDGTVLLEHVYNNPSTAETFTGIKLFDPATVDMLSYDNSDVLVRPDQPPPSLDHPTNVRGEPAAYVQYPDNRLKAPTVTLSLNDVTKIVRVPIFDLREPTGPLFKQSNGMSSNRGVSVIEPVTEEAERLRARMHDYNASIASMAYPRLKLEFEDVERPTGEIIKWDDDRISGYVDGFARSEVEKHWEKDKKWTDPGGVIGSNPGVETEIVQGDVPEIEESIDRSISLILSGLGVPKYTVGFGDNLSRRITKEIEKRFELKTHAMRHVIEAKLTEIFRKKAEELVEKGEIESAEGVSFALEPREEETPLENEALDLEQMNNLMVAIATFANSDVRYVIGDTQQFLGDMMSVDLSKYGEPDERPEEGPPGDPERSVPTDESGRPKPKSGESGEETPSDEQEDNRPGTTDST